MASDLFGQWSIFFTARAWTNPQFPALYIGISQPNLNNFFGKSSPVRCSQLPALYIGMLSRSLDLLFGKSRVALEKIPYPSVSLERPE